MRTESVRSIEFSALAAARVLGIDLNRTYTLLRLGRLVGRKDERGEWLVDASSVEHRLEQMRKHREGLRSEK